MTRYLGGYQDWELYTRWLGKRYFQRIWRENISNRIVVLIRAIRFIESEENIECDISREVVECRAIED